MKNWLRKKYTRPFVDGSYTEDFEIAQDSVRELIQRFPVIEVKESFHDYYERVKDLKVRLEESSKTIRTTAMGWSNRKIDLVKMLWFYYP